MTDQELLTEHERGRTTAFRELLERHGGLVYGVAFRVTGDRMMAEEVVQDVFCLLARKAPLMAGHPSVAGWLHRTALNSARGMQRRRRRHDRKLFQFASEGGGSRTGEWAEDSPREEVDLAIDRLPSDERDVVVLRYFHDLGYAEIGERLGVSEVAARKRVSRALQRLQATLGAPRLAVLAPGSLALAVPRDLLSAVVAPAPSATTGIGSFTTHILMTQKQTILATGAALLGGGLTWFGAAQWSENKRLSAEVARLNEVAAETRSSLSQAKAAVGGEDLASSSPGNLSAELDAVRAELEAEREKRLTAERDAQSLRDQTAGLSDEVVVSFGKVSEIGATLGSVFTEAIALSELEKSGGLDTPEGAARFGKFIEKAASISGISREIIGFEDKPEEGSQFVAATYAAAFGLDDIEKSKVAEFFTAQLAEAGKKSLTLSHLPEQGSAEFNPWLEQRWAFFNESRSALRDVIPEGKRATFDQWVEKGGYGFKNLKLKGSPLMFSLGGDPR